MRICIKRDFSWVLAMIVPAYKHFLQKQIYDIVVIQIERALKGFLSYQDVNIKGPLNLKPQFCAFKTTLLRRDYVGCLKNTTSLYYKEYTKVSYEFLKPPLML